MSTAAIQPCPQQAAAQKRASTTKRRRSAPSAAPRVPAFTQEHGQTQTPRHGQPLFDYAAAARIIALRKRDLEQSLQHARSMRAAAAKLRTRARDMIVRHLGPERLQLVSSADALDRRADAMAAGDSERVFARDVVRLHRQVNAVPTITDARTALAAGSSAQTHVHTLGTGDVRPRSRQPPTQPCLVVGRGTGQNTANLAAVEFARFQARHDAAGDEVTPLCTSDRDCSVCGALLTHESATDAVVCEKCGIETAFAGGSAAALSTLRGCGARYRKLNHFRAQLDQFLGRVPSHLSDNALRDIMKFLYDECGCRASRHVHAELVDRALVACKTGSKSRLVLVSIVAQLTGACMPYMTAAQEMHVNASFGRFAEVYEQQRVAMKIANVNMMRSRTVLWIILNNMKGGEHFVRHFLVNTKEHPGRVARNAQTMCAALGIPYVPFA